MTTLRPVSFASAPPVASPAAPAAGPADLYTPGSAAPSAPARPTLPPPPESVLPVDLTLPPGERGTLFLPEGGEYRRVLMNHVYGYSGRPEFYQEGLDEHGAPWVAFPTVDRDTALNVADPGGRIVARVNLRVDENHLSQVLLDAPRRRLYVLASRYGEPDPCYTIAAVNLETGKEAARLDLPGSTTGAHLQITPAGTLAFLGPGGCRDFDADLRPLRTLEEPEFIPSHRRDLADGSVLLEGSTFYQGDTLYSDYHPHRALHRPDGTRTPLASGADWLGVHEGELAWVADRAFVTRDLATGAERTKVVPSGTFSAFERPDGSVVAFSLQGGTPALRVVSEQGRVVAQHRLEDAFPNLKSLMLWDGGQRADAVIERQGRHELHRLDLAVPGMWEGLAGRLRSDEDDWIVHRHPLYTSPKPFVALALADGRTLCVAADGATVLDGEGGVAQAFPDLASARVALGDALRPVGLPFPGLLPFPERPADLLAAAERAVQPERGDGPIRFDAGTAPADEVQRLLPPVRAEDLQQTLWGRALQGVAVGSGLDVAFPGGVGSLRGTPERLTVMRDQRVLSEVGTHGGQKFTLALPLETASGTVMVAAATSDGTVLVYNGVSKYAHSTARRYPLGVAVTALAVGPDGALVARGSDGRVLRVDVGEALQAPGGAPAAADAPRPGDIERRADEVQIGGITLPIRPGMASLVGALCGVPAGPGLALADRE